LALKFSAVALVAFAAAIASIGSSAVAQGPNTLTGTFLVRVSGDRTDTCVDQFEQSGSELSFDTTCETFGPGTGIGTFDSESGMFSVTTQLSGYAVYISGTLSFDGTAIGGDWMAQAEPALRGTFVGQLQIPPPTETPLSTATPTSIAPTGTDGPATLTRPPDQRCQTRATTLKGAQAVTPC
jgi:hypothetical protein